MLDTNLALAVFAYGVKEDTLDSALVEHDLQESSYVQDGIGNAVPALDNPTVVWVPGPDFEHVI